MPPTPLRKPTRSSTRRQFLRSTAAAASGLALSSCGWRLAQIQSQTTTDKNLLYIYTWAGYTDDDLLDEFEKQTGIRAIADVFDSNESMLARVQAGGGGAYSIIYPSEYMVSKMAGLGLLAEIDPDRLPGLKQLFPRFRDPVYDPGNRHSIPLSWGTTGLIYNSARLKPPPEDWGYLWEEKSVLKNRMTLLNDLREVMGATLKKLGYSYNTTDEKAIAAAYRDLLDLKPSIASFDSDAWRARVLRGGLLLAMCYSADANEVIEEDDRLQYVLPKSGASLWLDTLVIPSFAPNPEAAYKWINFMLQPQITADICERLSFATPNKAAYELLDPEVRENTILFPPERTLEKCEPLAPLSDKVLEVYDRYWTQLTSA